MLLCSNKFFIIIYFSPLRQAYWKQNAGLPEQNATVRAMYPPNIAAMLTFGTIGRAHGHPGMRAASLKDFFFGVDAKHFYA
jgi:hypothetical protein